MSTYLSLSVCLNMCLNICLSVFCLLLCPPLSESIFIYILFLFCTTGHMQPKKINRVLLRHRNEHLSRVTSSYFPPPWRLPNLRQHDPRHYQSYVKPNHTLFSSQCTITDSSFVPPTLLELMMLERENSFRIERSSCWWTEDDDDDNDPTKH